MGRLSNSVEVRVSWKKGSRRCSKSQYWHQVAGVSGEPPFMDSPWPPPLCVLMAHWTLNPATIREVQGLLTKRLIHLIVGSGRPQATSGGLIQDRLQFHGVIHSKLPSLDSLLPGEPPNVFDGAYLGRRNGFLINFAQWKEQDYWSYRCVVVSIFCFRHLEFGPELSTPRISTFFLPFYFYKMTAYRLGWVKKRLRNMWQMLGGDTHTDRQTPSEVRKSVEEVAQDFQCFAELLPFLMISWRRRNNKQRLVGKGCDLCIENPF